MAHQFHIGIATLLATALLAPAASAQQPKTGGTITIALTEEPDTLDPQRTSTQVASMILRYAGDTLVQKDPEGQIIAGLASSWTVSNDGLTYTFKLKPGVKFHNGAALDAAAVKASIERAIDPNLKSPITAGYFDQLASVTTPDKNTVVIKLKKPSALFLENLADSRASIVHASSAKSVGNQFGRAPVLSGPWMISKWDSGTQITLKRNPNYNWGPAYVHKGPAYLEQLTFRVIPDSATQISAFKANDVQALTTVPPNDVASLESARNATLNKSLRTGVGLFLEFNTTKAPFNDVRVRKAINMLVNKDALVKVVLKDLGVPACGPLSPSLWGYWKNACSYAPEYDVTAAKALLSQAGWKPGPGNTLQKDGKPFEFTLYTAPIDTWTQSAQLVQAMLQQAGIKMNIQQYEFGTLLEKTKAGEDQAHFMGYTYPNADIVYLWFHSDNDKTGLNLSHYKNATLDQLIDRSRTTTNSSTRMSTYQAIQQHIIDQALWAPLWINENYSAVRPNLKGVKVSFDGSLILNDAYLESK
ncbi:ABC transporter substrate-binding protein [Deinococcus peraridilitoris]|uniref:ABC-type dipeptide transport system, periplasmic component n=1 Tax=Deinococcus peraridilitoris (strain DSM 19664 / LMG 22246 / CIP 109416 / KR-200) TaxID=937777 RepID=L0A8J6_DEIPD|nr:ABC transporter substrate-binding protein [Deinococcus peraridilitoris]AFZ69405.1 ABC-type dipeptide transport system, periplasmic component [Deinococcus peraridilitoris DSM 19664]